MKRILIIEDDSPIAELERDYLELEGYQIHHVIEGQEGLKQALSGQFDLIILDIMLPGLDGFFLCRQLRKELEVPIIMVSAKREDMDKIRGLGVGADDYIVKPFSPGEIIARINAILRRITPKNDESAKIFIFDNLEIDLNNFTVKINDEIISLTKKEIEILWTLATNQNKVFTRENLLDLIWGFDYFGESRTVDTHIKRLRAKLDNYKHEKWNIKTIWGVGYKFDVLEN